MNDKKTIVILYSKGIYDGAALALGSYFNENYEDCYCICIDDDKYTTAGGGARHGYIFSMRNAPWLSRYYNRTSNIKKAFRKSVKAIKPEKEPTNWLGRVVKATKTYFTRVKNILIRYEPETVLCFSPKALKQALKAKEQLRMYNMNIYSCMSDYCADPRFVNARCTGYLVTNDSVKSDMVMYGADANKVRVIGMPFLVNAYKRYDRETVKGFLNIVNDKPNLLISGGRYGNSYVKNVFSEIIKYTDHFNVILLTGGSKSIETFAAQLVKDNSEGIVIVSDIDDMCKLYSVADAVVCSPTAYETFDALFFSLPTVLIKGSNGIENGNADYLIGNGYALDGRNKEKLIGAISLIMLDEEEREYMASRASSFTDKDDVIRACAWLDEGMTELFARKNSANYRKDGGDDEVEEI